MRPSARSHSLVAVVVIAIATATVALSVCLWCGGLGAVAALFWRARQPTTDATLTPAASYFRPLNSLGAARDLAAKIAGTATTDTDYWLLSGLLGDGKGKPSPRAPVHELPEYQVGDVHKFWMGDEEAQRYWQVRAELKVKTDSAYLYVARGSAYDDETLAEAAALFEDQIYPSIRRHFGLEWKPGIDGDPRVTILVTDEMPPGIAGYFSTSDEYPRSVMPYSNEREMIYVTSSYLDDIELFGQLLSHEFQHMVHWNQDLSEATWVNEGLSLLAEEVNGYGSVLGIRRFRSDPDVQLTSWAEEPSDRLRNYAASKLFMSYLSQHYGGFGVMSDLVHERGDGIDGVNNALRAQGFDVAFEDVFADWVVANLLDDGDVAERQYAYEIHTAWEPSFSARLDDDSVAADWVHQYGADYIEIDPRAGRKVAFEGAEAVRVAPTDPFAGQSSWWSNRRNMLSSSITRQVDLSEVNAATLRFYTWYDIEEGFDYGYVAVSTDSGRTWETLPGTSTTSEDPNEANYGHGYTGKSGAWLEERVDLTPFAGQRILLRFWYITDPGLTQPGWLLDEIAIPEIGFSDGGERGNGRWTVDGFVRSSNDLAQTYLVQLAELGSETIVRMMALDAHNRGELWLGDDTRRAVLIVSGATRWTSELAPYRVRLSDGRASPPDGLRDSR